jgi:hypothetical protein
MSRHGRHDDRSPSVASQSVGRDTTPRPDRTPSLPTGQLTLRPGLDRKEVQHRHRTYRLRDSDVRLLATVGTFRVVRADDVQPMRSSRDASAGDLRHLREQGLIETKTVTVNGDPLAVVVLTGNGKSLLEAHQEPSSDGPRQAYHAGLVKPRELAHDAQLLRLFQAEASRIEDDGGRIERVLLDYELKREYQTFLNRSNRPESGADSDVETFAARHELTVVDGHLELPDLRIEYEDAEGRLVHRDVELVTEHYSRAQLAGKARAGFSMYRAAGAARLGGRGGRAGGTPVDPHHLEWLG